MRWRGRWSTSRSGAAERLGGDVLLVGATSVGSAAVGFALVPVLARVLGLEAYGVFVQFQTTVDLVATFALLGLPYAMLRYLPGRPREEGAAALSAATLAALGVSLAGALLLLLLSPRLADWFFGGAREPVWVAAAMLPLQVVDALFLNHFRVRQRLGLFALGSASLAVGRLAAVGIALLLDAGLLGVLAAVLLFQALHALAMFIGASLIEGLAAPRAGVLGGYLRFGVPTLPGVLSTWVVSMSDRYVLGLFLGPAAVGAYHPAVLLGSLLQLLVVPFDIVLTGAIARKHNEGDADGTRRLLDEAAQGYAWLAVPALVGLSLLAQPVLAILVGAEAAATASRVVPWAAASWLCYGLLVLSASPLFFLHERTRWGAAVWGGSAALNLALNLLLVPRLGLVGAAVGTFASYLAALAVAWILAARLGPVALPWRPLLRAGLASVPMALVVLLLSPETLPGAALAALGGGACYLVVHRLLPGGAQGGFPLRRA